MYKNPEEVAKRAGNAYEYIIQDRTWAACAKHFMEELERLDEQK
jgi:hypothetical protein